MTVYMFNSSFFPYSRLNKHATNSISNMFYFTFYWKITKSCLIFNAIALCIFINIQNIPSKHWHTITFDIFYVHLQMSTMFLFGTMQICLWIFLFCSLKTGLKTLIFCYHRIALLLTRNFNQEEHSSPCVIVCKVTKECTGMKMQKSNLSKLIVTLWDKIFKLAWIEKAVTVHAYPLFIWHRHACWYFIFRAKLLCFFFAKLSEIHIKVIHIKVTKFNSLVRGKHCYILVIILVT